MRRSSATPFRALALASLASLVVASASCGGEAPLVEPGETDTARSALFANDKAMFDYFVGKGLTPFQAAGIVGNLDQESGGNPMASQPGGPGRGIAQWSVGGRWDTDANDNAVWFASKQGQSVWSLQLQLDFIWYELTTFSYFGLAALKATTNVTDATVVFQNKYEGCGTCVQTQRVKYAMDVLAAYGNSTPPDYAATFVSQTHPFAGAGPVTLMVGQTVAGSIVFKNAGAKPWKAGVTKLAPIPRDQASPFHASSWLSPTRVSTLAQDVAPGQNGTFAWDLSGSAPGDFSPFFGLVEEGVTWFADSGGPPDDQIQVHVVVTPGAGTGGSGGAGGSGTAGTGAAGKGGSSSGAAGTGAAGKAGAAGGAGSGSGAGGSSTAGKAGAGASPAAGGSGGAGAAGAATGDVLVSGSDEESSGCVVAGAGGRGAAGGVWLLVLAGLWMRRRG